MADTFTFEDLQSAADRLLSMPTIAEGAYFIRLSAPASRFVRWAQSRRSPQRALRRMGRPRFWRVQ